MTTQDIQAKLKQYPIAVGSLVVAVVLGAVVYLRSDAIPTLEAKERDLQAQSATINFNEAQSVGLGEDLETLRGYVASVADRLVDPDRSRLAINQQYLYELEQKTGVRLVALSQGEVITDSRQRPGKPTPKEYVGVPFTVAVQGPFPKVLAFLLEIERGQRLSRVDSLTLSLAPVEAGDLVSMSLQFEFLGKK